MSTDMAKWFTGIVIGLLAFSMFGGGFFGILGTLAAGFFGSMLLFGGENSQSTGNNGQNYAPAPHGRHRQPYQQVAELAPPLNTPGMVPGQEQTRTF